MKEGQTMEYMKWLKEYAGLYNRELRLTALVGWTNRLYANQVWKQKSGKSKNKLDRKDLTEFRERLRPIVEAANLDVTLLAVRVPVRDLPMAFAGQVFGLSLWQIDWPKLGNEVVAEWSDVIARAGEAAEESVRQYEDFILSLISLWGITKRSERKIVNQALNAMLHAYPQWRKLIDTSAKTPYAEIERVADRTVAAPIHTKIALRNIAEWLETTQFDVKGGRKKLASNLRAVAE